MLIIGCDFHARFQQIASIRSVIPSSVVEIRE